ncbi:CHAT domain-containing protein [Phormidesmis sp. 146-35]
MKVFRRILLFLVTVGLLIGLYSPLRGWAVQKVTPRPNPQELKQALDRKDIPAAIRLVETGWKQQYEDYYQGRLTSQLLEADAIARTLGRLSSETGKRSALFYMIPTPTALELILVSPGAAPIHRRVSAANRTVLLQVMQEFRLGVVNRESDPGDYLPAARQLYNWMIAPLESELRAQRIDHLIFCLGTGLRSAPLAALYDGRQFLIEKYSLGIIPAFNLLDRRAASLAGTQILAMGASEFKNQAPLPAVPVELSAITGNLWRGKSLLNQDFTLANLKAQRAATPFGIIHLATHAEFLPGEADESYIQFWDSQLRIDQVRFLNLRAPAVQLLVLSACRTALGDPRAELGFAGFAVQSGAQAAIASLWSVSDAGTLVLMSEFYRHLKTAPIKADGLRQAQLDLLKKRVNLKTSVAMQARGVRLPSELEGFATTDLSHPYYWAAFTVIGNPW